MYSWYVLRRMILYLVLLLMQADFTSPFASRVVDRSRQMGLPCLRFLSFYDFLATKCEVNRQKCFVLHGVLAAQEQAAEDARVRAEEEAANLAREEQVPLSDGTTALRLFSRDSSL